MPNAHEARLAADIKTGCSIMRKKAKATVAPKPSLPTDFGPYLTTTEAALYIKVSKPFLEGARYRADGSGPDFVKLKKIVRYKRTVLDAFMNAHDHAADVPLARAR